MLGNTVQRRKRCRGDEDEELEEARRQPSESEALSGVNDSRPAPANQRGVIWRLSPSLERLNFGGQLSIIDSGANPLQQYLSSTLIRPKATCKDIRVYLFFMAVKSKEL